MGKTKKYIDYLKLTGLLGLTLAHVNLPGIIMQLRNFDVPLMVFASGILAADSFKRSDENAINYIKKRVFRLLLPTWIFLTLYFIIREIAGYSADADVIIKSYLLLRDSWGSIGYVWIIWIYIMCACVTPFLLRLNIHNKIVLCGIVFVYILYEICCYFQMGMKHIYVDCTIYYIIPYSFILLLGIKFHDITAKSKLLLCTGNAIIYIILAILFAIYGGGYQNTQIFKYPPRIYYLSYAVFITVLLTIFMESMENKLKEINIVRFIASSTLWIYLWHILYLQFITIFLPNGNWTLTYFLVMLMSISTVWIQNKIADLLEKHGINKVFVRLFRG